MAPISLTEPHEAPLHSVDALAGLTLVALVGQYDDGVLDPRLPIKTWPA